MEQEISFAYRYWQIKPTDLAPNEPWKDHNSVDQPRPPKRWHRQGFSREEWRSWKGVKPLSDRHVVARKAFSLVWCQRTQQFWVTPGDCTDVSAPGYQDLWSKWSPLYCDHLPGSGDPGLWRLSEHGNGRQHASVCPPLFDEFLPVNFFMGVTARQACHFFGDLSLILGLLAMCPDDVNNIERQIDHLFYYQNRPQFVSYTRLPPTVGHSNSPRDKLGRLFSLPLVTWN